MRLGAELDNRVNEALAGMDARLKPMLKAFALSILNDAYTEGHQDGVEDGKEAGYRECLAEREEE